MQVSRAMQRSLALQRLLLITVLGATCMLIGDGTLTPAISVVSSITGLQQNTSIGQREQHLTALPICDRRHCDRPPSLCRTLLSPAVLKHH